LKQENQAVGCSSGTLTDLGPTIEDSLKKSFEENASLDHDIFSRFENGDEALPE